MRFDRQRPSRVDHGTVLVDGKGALARSAATPPLPSPPRGAMLAIRRWPIPASPTLGAARAPPPASGAAPSASVLGEKAADRRQDFRRGFLKQKVTGGQRLALFRELGDEGLTPRSCERVPESASGSLGCHRVKGQGGTTPNESRRSRYLPPGVSSGGRCCAQNPEARVCRLDRRGWW